MEKVEWAEKYETPSFFDERLKGLWERCREAQKTLDDVIKDLERMKNENPKGHRAPANSSQR